MKNKKSTLVLLAVLLLVLGTAAFLAFRVHALESSLIASEQEQRKLETTLKAYDKLFEVDSLLLEDNYSDALNAYEAQFDTVGELENNRVQLRIAVANKFAALNDGIYAARRKMARGTHPDSTALENSISQKRLLQNDSLQFALEKTKAQLSLLKRKWDEKSSGKYLTFTNTKGSEVHYVGNVKDDRANGMGLALLNTGSRYEGEWKDNKRHGQGTFFWGDGEYYIGEYVDDKRSGQGTYYWSNGEKFVGSWKNDLRTGKGTFYSKDGKVVHGIWKDDELVDTFKKQKQGDDSIAGNGR